MNSKLNVLPELNSTAVEPIVQNQKTNQTPEVKNSKNSNNTKNDKASMEKYPHYTGPLVMLVLSVGIIVALAEKDTKHMTNAGLKMLIFNTIVIIGFYVSRVKELSTMHKSVIVTMCGFAIASLGMIMALIETKFDPDEPVTPDNEVNSRLTTGGLTFMVLMYAGISVFVLTSDYPTIAKYIAYMITSFGLLVASVILTPAIVNSKKPTFDALTDFFFEE